MLPPLNLADARRDFFSPRKRSQVRRSTVEASTLAATNAMGFISQNAPEVSRDASSTPFPIPETPRATDADSTSSGSSPVTRLTLIPREFFVVERNNILPAGQYPPTVYQSRFTGGEGGLWETIVFPALAPQTRQQVLYLRQTLEKLREALLCASAAEDASPSSPSAANGSPRRRDRVQRAVVEYTKQEARIYSVCFHELTRQVKFICKEQSELLHEVRERYDAIIGRLADRIQQLGEELSHRNERINELVSEAEHLRHANAALKRANARQAELIADFERHPSNRDGNDDDGSEEDDEEAQVAEWQRQRRQLASVDAVISTKKRRDSVAEENLAAARVQTAFHKFQMRKAQHALALRVEKNVAALDIQRSYRGFRDRQRMLHHRAVLQTIVKRRKQIAAVELLQENVRAYLHKRRHSLVARRKANNAPTAVNPSSADNSVPVSTAAGPTATLNPLAPISESASEFARQSMAVVEANPSRDLLHKILVTSGELMTAVRQLQSHTQRGSIVVVECEPSGPAPSASLVAVVQTHVNDTAGGDGTVGADGSINVHSAAILPSDEEETKLLWRTLQQTRSLVVSLEEVLGASHNNAVSSAGDPIDAIYTPQTIQGAEFDPPEAVNVVSVGVSTSTSSLDSLNAIPSKEDESAATAVREPEGELRSKIVTPLLEHAAVSPSQDDSFEHDSDGSAFHLDDSLWRSATYYATTDHNSESQQRLLVLLSSREQRKRLVQLKQFISDIYDTIVGRTRELPPSQLADAIRLRASLALSCDEWQQQRRLLLLNAADSSACGRVLAAAIPFDLQAMSREHFRCQLGLNNLVEAAMQDLHAAAECFAPVDPDVEVFRGFLTHERLYDELEFRCVCRYLCAQGGSLGPTSGASLAFPVGQSTKQPVFHPSTMREVLPVASALQVARLLFRVDEQEALIASDGRYVEVDNAVYRQYLPLSGYQQCEEIVSRYFPAASVALGSQPPNPPSSSAAAPAVTSPCALMTALTRPTNCSQFHAKQYNTTAPRSPLVRRQYQQQAASQRLTQPSQSGGTGSDGSKWIYFDDFVALLLKYRAEMHSFHLFLQWTVELFNLSVDAGAPSSAPFVSERAFAAALAPISLGPSDRELRNLFHNALRQRHLHLHMPLRTFTSVVLLLLENRMISVSKYAPLDKQRRSRTDGLRALLDAYAPAESAASQREDCTRAWRVLAQQWRVREADFEGRVESLYQAGGSDGYRRVLRLMQLRNELYDLLANRSASTLLRGHEVYEELVDGMDIREQKHADGMEDVIFLERATNNDEADAGGDGEGDVEEDQGDWTSEADSCRSDSPWPTDSQQS